jgi:hypothetical protein
VRLAIRIERVRDGLEHELDHGIGTAREAKKLMMSGVWEEEKSNSTGEHSPTRMVSDHVRFGCESIKDIQG